MSSHHHSNSEETAEEARKPPAPTPADRVHYNTAPDTVKVTGDATQNTVPAKTEVVDDAPPNIMTPDSEEKCEDAEATVEKPAEDTNEVSQAILSATPLIISETLPAERYFSNQQVRLKAPDFSLHDNVRHRGLNNKKEHAFRCSIKMIESTQSPADSKSPTTSPSPDAKKRQRTFDDEEEMEREENIYVVANVHEHLCLWHPSSKKRYVESFEQDITCTAVSSSDHLRFGKSPVTAVGFDTGLVQVIDCFENFKVVREFNAKQILSETQVSCLAFPTIPKPHPSSSPGLPSTSADAKPKSFLRQNSRSFSRSNSGKKLS